MILSFTDNKIAKIVILLFTDNEIACGGCGFVVLWGGEMNSEAVSMGDTASLVCFALWGAVRGRILGG